MYYSTRIRNSSTVEQIYRARSASSAMSERLDIREDDAETDNAEPVESDDE